jgi:hypothetical protein
MALTKVQKRDRIKRRVRGKSLDLLQRQDFLFTKVTKKSTLN